ncbi:MAG: cation:proton antiporter [Thermoleophilia bacterium]|nr:cation:proton antiporter [Thermoleophilia bacterium]
MAPRDVITTVAIVLGAGLLARVVAAAARLPEILLLLASGAIVGPAVAGWIDVPLDSAGTQVLLTLGVSFILFHGGLGLSARVLSGTAVGLALLVVPGVVLTTAITGAVAAAVFHVEPLVGFLVGAALAPTDPAILVPLFDRLRVRPKVAQTIVAESALNDPTGAVLALALAGAVASGSDSLSRPALAFVEDVAISTAIGIGLGLVLALVVSSRRTGIWRESSAIAVITVVAGAYASIDFAGGSGYLGAFLAGVIVGNMAELRHVMHPWHEIEVGIVVAAVADVAVIFVFVILGSDLPFDAIGEHWLPALAVVATLMLVARPLSVLVCLAADRRGGWQREEVVFLAWTRETGVVPAALAGILVADGIDGAELVTVCVALALVVTVMVQSTTKPWLARRLGLADGTERERYTETV